MNLPPDEYILVEEERELEFLNACFAAAGIDAGHGELVSRLLVNSDLRGVRSHGIGYAPGYCRSFREGKLNAHPDVLHVHQHFQDGDILRKYLFEWDGEPANQLLVEQPRPASV